MALSGDATIDNYDKTVEAVFDRALAIGDPQARRSFLQNACGDDDQFCRDVESLLEAHEQAKSFLEASPAAQAGTLCGRVQEGPGTNIGRYKLLEQIGEGGFGVVYMAEQQEPFRRRVALKVIKLGMDTKQVIGRFEAERQALALMDHVNIARVFDAGSTEAGRPYFVMELVKGIPITEFCDSAELGAREGLELFCRVCDAVQHAHQKGVIHRDIKPSNVLVAMHDDRPVPKVIDFGIAKATVHRLTERTVFTEMRQLIGTPAYMSPEQATFNNLDIDTRSDVYSLGALLYELLTGTAPFDDRRLRSLAYDELCRVIREDVPPTPSQRVSTVNQAAPAAAAPKRQQKRIPDRFASWYKSDIDWIVMKALAKDRQQRYDSPNSLATDIGRFLRSEPVSAVRPSAAYRLGKFVMRHRTLAANLAVVLITLVIGAAVALVGFVRAEIAGAKLQEQLVQNRRLLYRSDLQRAMRAWYDGRLNVVDGLLQRHSPQLSGEDLRGFEWYYLWNQIRPTKNVFAFPHERAAFDFVFTHDGTKVVCADGRDLKVWDIQSGIAATFSGHTDRILALGRADRGRFIVSGGIDGTIRLWDLEEQTHAVLAYTATENEEATDTVIDLELSADGSMLAVLFDAVGRINFWNPTSGRELEPLSYSDSCRPNYICLSKDGQYLASAWDEAYRPVFWDLRTRRTFTLKNLGDGAYSMAISPQDILAVGSTDGTISLWDLEKRTSLGHLVGHVMVVTSLAFSPDGRRLASGSYDNVVRLWDLSLRRTLGLLRGHADGVAAVQFGRDGERVASLAGDGTIKVWNVDDAKTESFVRHNAPVSSVAFIESGKNVVSLGMDGSIRSTDCRTRTLTFADQLPLNGTRGKQKRRTNREELYGGTVAADGRTLVAGTNQGKVILYDLTAHAVTREIQAHKSAVWWPAVAPDGCTCVTASRDGSVRLWELSSGREIKEFIRTRHPFEGAAFSPAGNYVAAASFGGSVYVWDAHSGRQLVSQPPAYHGRLYRVVFSTDGRRLAACGDDSRIVLWDLPNGVVSGLERRPRYLSGHTGRVIDLSFSPDGKLLASAGVGSVLLWEVNTGELRATFRDHRRDVTCVAFSPDGKMLVSGDAAGNVVLRNATPPDSGRTD